MAIQDSFNLSNALNSQAYAYKCWYNYNYGNNTMGISAKDMGEITQTWNGELNNWHATALDDENAYEIEDDDFSTSRNNGRNQAEDKTGYDGKQGGQYVRTGLDAAAGVAGALGSTINLFSQKGKYDKILLKKLEKKQLHQLQQRLPQKKPEKKLLKV